MPKTRIEIKTFMCPTGLGNPNASCRFHVPETELVNHKKCPNCNKKLEKATDPLDKMSMTIVGDEEVEDEINPDHERPLVHKMEVKTDGQKDAYREKRREDISEAIKEARKLEDK